MRPRTTHHSPSRRPSKTHEITPETRLKHFLEETEGSMINNITLSFLHLRYPEYFVHAISWASQRHIQKSTISLYQITWTWIQGDAMKIGYTWGLPAWDAFTPLNQVISDFNIIIVKILRAAGISQHEAVHVHRRLQKHATKIHSHIHPCHRIKPKYNWGLLTTSHSIR